MQTSRSHNYMTIMHSQYQGFHIASRHVMTTQTTPRRVTRRLNMINAINVRGLDILPNPEVRPKMKEVVGSPKSVKIFQQTLIAHHICRDFQDLNPNVPSIVKKPLPNTSLQSLLNDATDTKLLCGKNCADSSSINNKIK